MNVVPDRCIIQRNCNLLAVYMEKSVGEGLVKHGQSYIPDRTTRNKVEETSAIIFKVKGEMFAMKVQRIGKNHQSTWADIIVHYVVKA